MVTRTLDGSDFDEESDFEDSEEDWRPEKGDPKALKRKTRDIITGTVSGRRGGGGGGGGSRTNGKQKRSRKPAAATKGRTAGGRKQRKPADDDDDEDDSDEDDDDRFDSDESGSSSPPAPKRGRNSRPGKTPPRGRKSGSSKTSPSTSKTVKMSPGSSAAAAAASAGGLDSSGSELTVKPIQRKVVNVAGSFPDKSGYLKLFASRADLEEGIRDNLKVCLWRRDGSSLLQKYFRDKSVDASTPQFTSSMVYSCWEDKRADEYMEVKVRCIEQSKQLRVQIIDVDATECRAKEEYVKYIELHGKPTDGSDGSDSEQQSLTGNGNGAFPASSAAAKRGSEDENGAEEEDDDDGGGGGGGLDGDGEEEDEIEDDASQEE